MPPPFHRLRRQRCSAEGAAGQDWPDDGVAIDPIWMAPQHLQHQRRDGSQASDSAVWPGVRLLATAAALMPVAGLAATPLPFPSQESFRQLQLAALACARENSSASCEPVRRLADPLLDHPRLPAACKDQLWSLSQKAQVSVVNSYSRREAIAQPAQLLLLACRSGEKPRPAPPASGPGATTPQFGDGKP